VDPALVERELTFVNLRPLDESARGIGAINWVPDRDQIIRRVALVFRLNETLIPSLAAEALRIAQGASSYVLKASNASGETGFGEAGRTIRLSPIFLQRNAPEFRRAQTIIIHSSVRIGRPATCRSSLNYDV